MARPKKENKNTALALSQNNKSLAFNNSKQFAEALIIEKEKRNLLKKYIETELKDGIDYGPIHIYKDCQYHKQAWRQSECPEWHFSKNTLFKAGAEKFISLLNLKPLFSIDKESLEVYPENLRAQGVFFYCCYLEHRESGEIISEGRGACTLAEKFGQVNTALKIAKKRALIDAVLNIGLSDTFTQDIEEDGAAEIDAGTITGQEIINNSKIPAQTKYVNTDTLKKTRTKNELIDDIKKLYKDLTENQGWPSNSKWEKFMGELEAKRTDTLKKAYENLEYTFHSIVGMPDEENTNKE